MIHMVENIIEATIKAMIELTIEVIIEATIEAWRMLETVRSRLLRTPAA